MTLSERVYVFMLFIGIPFLMTVIVGIVCGLINQGFQKMRRSQWYAKFWAKYIDKPQYILICVECGERIYEDTKCLPDYPGIYQCPSCGHPNAKGDNNA